MTAAGCSAGGPRQGQPRGPQGPIRNYSASPLEAPERGDPTAGASSANWGERMREAPDLDGDGAPDLVVGNPAYTSRCCQREGRAYVVSGRDRSVIYTVPAPTASEGAGFATFVAVFTGPAGPAVAIGSSREAVEGRKAQGRAYVFSLGATGATLLYALDDPTPEADARFGERIGRAGDVTGHGNGASDLIVAAPGHDVPTGCGASPDPDPAACRLNVGQAFVFDGASGALVRALDMPTGDAGTPPSCNRRNSCGSFGSAVQSPGDVDLDGRGDQLVSAYGFDFSTGSGSGCDQPEPSGCNEGQGRQYLFSGADGRVLATVDDPEPQPGAKFGFQDVAPDSPGDVNGDAVPDLYANGFEQAGPAGPDEGGAWVFDGKKTVGEGRGVVMYKIRDPSPSLGGQFGWSMARTDFEPDGTPDLLVGSAPHHLTPGPGAPWPDQRGGAAVLKGSDGKVLEVLEPSPNLVETGANGNLGSNLGWSVAAPGDVDADGKPDYVAGAPYTDVGGVRDQGRIVFFLSG